MGLSLKKIFRGVKKLAKNPLVQAGVGLATGVGPGVALLTKAKGAVKAIKGVGQSIKATRGIAKIPPVSIRAMIHKNTSQSIPVKRMKAVAFPGGAKINGTPKRAKRVNVRKLAGTKNTHTRGKAAALGGAKPQRARRVAPSGGKDLKALSASWRAAGKPGKWIDWVKSH